MVQVKFLNGLSYLERGPKKATSLVFLHGFPDSKEIWIPTMKTLDDIHCLAIDLPSFGSSNIVADDEMKISAIAKRVFETLMMIDIKETILIGHDWGAFIAWALAIGSDLTIKKLILSNGTNPSVYADLYQNSAAQRQIGSYASQFCNSSAANRLLINNMRGLKMYHPFVAIDGPGSEIFFEHLWNDEHRLNSALGIYRANFNDIISNKLAFGKVNCPLALFWGKDDHSLVIDHVAAMSNLCSGPVQSLITDGGHWSFVKDALGFSTFIKDQIK